MTGARIDPTPDEPGYRTAPDAGDPVCWLHRVCPECGAFTEHPAVACWRCGALADDEKECL